MTSLAATLFAEPDAQRGGIIFKLMFMIALVLFLVILYLVRVPLLRFAGEFWIVDDAPESSDAIVVLSAIRQNVLYEKETKLEVEGAIPLRGAA